MKKMFTILCMVIGASTLYAQDEKPWWESFNQESRKETQKELETYHKTETKEKGFVAPNDGSLTLAYDRQMYRLSGPGASGDPFKLNGVKVGGTFHARIKGALGMEIPLLFRMGYMKDSDPDDTTLDYMKKTSLGLQMGFMICTSYRFRRKCYITLAAGPKLDFTMMASQIERGLDGSRTMYDFISGDGTYKYNGNVTTLDNDNLKQNKIFDLPFSFGATFRYKAIGLSVHYDVGTINRCKDAYYRVAGVSTDFIKRRDDFLTVGLQIYFGKIYK